MWLLTVLVLLWLGDYALFRYRLSHGTAYGSVKVDHYLSVQLKNGRQQFDNTGSDQESCGHSIFPHGATIPCWHLQRHRDQRESL